MKRWIFLLSMCFVLDVAVVYAQNGSDRESDLQAIEQVVGYYFAGVENHDEQSMRRAFHPDFEMWFVDGEGALRQVTLEEWIERLRGAEPGSTKGQRHVVSIDVAGNAAAVRAVGDFPTFQFIDYISLLEIEGEWKIVNKIFYRKEK